MSCFSVLRTLDAQTIALVISLDGCAESSGLVRGLVFPYGEGCFRFCAWNDVSRIVDIQSMSHVPLK